MSAKAASMDLQCEASQPPLPRPITSRPLLESPPRDRPYPVLASGELAGGGAAIADGRLDEAERLTRSATAPTLKFSQRHNALKPVKKGMEQVMCWALGLPATTPGPEAHRVSDQICSRSTAKTAGPTDASDTPSTQADSDTASPASSWDFDEHSVAPPKEEGETKTGQTPVVREASTPSAWQEDEFELLRSPPCTACGWSAAAPKPLGRSDVEEAIFSSPSSIDMTWQDSKRVSITERRPGMFGCGASSNRTSPPRGMYLATKLFPSCSGTPCGRSRMQESPPRQMVAPDREVGIGMFQESAAHSGKERDEREELMRELFGMHDLNGDGLLAELELIQLNKKIAVLHHGDGVDKAEVSAQFSTLFRSKLDPNGRPVSYEVFRRHMVDTLQELDSSSMAQTMILEQFVAEAESAHQIFRSMSMYSKSDAPLLRSMQLVPKCDAAWDGCTQTAGPRETGDAMSVVNAVQADACTSSNADSDCEEGI